MGEKLGANFRVRLNQLVERSGGPEAVVQHVTHATISLRSLRAWMSGNNELSSTLKAGALAQALGVSTYTLVYHFGSKEGLLEAFGLYEQDNFDAGVANALAGLSGADRLDAALRFIVDFQNGYSLGSLAEVEPEHGLQQMKRVLPIMRDRIARIIGGEQAHIAASAVVRIAVCHYVIGDDTPDGFLAELRHAAGLSRAGLPA